MLAAFMTSRVHCSKQARSCLRLPCRQKSSVPPTSSLFFLGGAVLAPALFSSDAGICIACFSPFVDGAIVHRSGLMLFLHSSTVGRCLLMHLDPDRGGDMQILTFFKFPLVADSFGSAFPAREQKEVDRMSDCINSV